MTAKKKATKKKPTKRLPPHVASAMRDAGLTAAERDARGLMPVAKARAFLAKRRTIVRGRGRMINGIYVWDSDIAWAALLSLGTGKELLATATKTWATPPRGLDNPAVAERYGDDAQAWVARLLDNDNAGPGVPCLGATLLATSGNEAGYRAMARLDALHPESLFLWQWLKKFPKGWRFAASDAPSLERLRKTDAKGVVAALEEGGAKKGGATHISLGAIEPHFKDFTYPMWDNANYFTGAMRVTGFVCKAGEALVWEQIMTGLGDGGITREVTVHPSFAMKHTWGVHREQLLSEEEVTKWDGEDSVSQLTGVRLVGGKVVVPPEGVKTSVRVRKLKGEIPIAIDARGLSPKDAALLVSRIGPRERVMIRLGQAPYRAKVFPPLAELAKEAKLPRDAQALFSFDVFTLPKACEPAASCPDVVAMVDALAARTKLKKLPSHGRHPLASLVERVRVLGGWGQPALCGPTQKSAAGRRRR